MTPTKVMIALFLGLFCIGSSYAMRAVFELGLLTEPTATLVAVSLIGIGIFLLGFLVFLPLWASLVLRGALREHVVGYASWADWIIVRKRGN